MGAIRVMPPQLAAKIAAGEVIERPASVVKELLENALDAGATSVQIEVDAGGTERIAVADNGCGIASDEVELAFRRHATSKLARESDLDQLATLGFRGEALPSVASVADVVCLTRVAEQPVGTEFRIEKGSLEHRPLARQTGTTMTVLGLFDQFPARRKFLRSRSAEAAACVQAVAPLVLAFPEVQVTLLVDGRVALRSAGDGLARGAAVAVLGAEADPHLLDVPQTVLADETGRPVVEVRGVCATGAYHRANRSGVYVLLNRRPIQNRALSFAVVEAYGSLVPVGRQPVAILDVRVPPSEVDFNVHPSKLEVKLLRERMAYAGVQRALRHALAEGGWSITPWRDASDPGSALPALGTDVGPSSASDPRGAGWPALPSWGSRAAAPAADASTEPEGWPHPERLDALRLLGQANRTYLIAEGDAGIYLVDQHAAHERVLLEDLRRAGYGRSEQQLLLEPLVVDVPASALAVLDELPAELQRLGFELEPFGPRQLLVRAVPGLLAERQPGRALAETLTALTDNSHGLVVSHDASWVERLALVLACKTAVRAGDALAEPEMRALLRRLGESELCRTCAHGRPTALLLTHVQLERQFGRR
jgi:DNA mismatch repair protein MutL